MHSLRLKLILVFVGLILIAITGIGLYGYLFTRTALSGQALERSRYQVHQQADSLESSLAQARGDALYLSVLRSLQTLRSLRHEGASEAEINVWRDEVAQDFLMFSSARPMYQAIRYIDADGKEVVSVKSDGRQVTIADPLTDQSDGVLFRSTMALDAGGVYVSAFTQEQEVTSEGRPFVHCALKLPDDDGIVLIDLHAGWLLRNLPADPGSDTWVLVDQDGHFLVYPEGFDPATNTLDIHQVLSGQAGSFEDTERAVVFDAVYPSTATPERFWVIYRDTPKSVLYSDVTSFYAITTAIILGGLMIGLALSLFAGDRMLKPLLDLQKQMAAYGHGGPVPELPEHLSDDEVGTLTQTFCEMAQELEHKREQEHLLIKKLINAQEEERKLVAYDLHDGLIQQMVGARLYLTDSCERCNGDTCRGLKLGSEALTEAIVEGRRIVEGLRPAVLDDLGLTVAIVEVAQAQARMASWNLKLDVQSLSEEPDNTVGVTLFRIAQEALNNIRKHANAKQVSLSVHNGTGIELHIEDDGHGFDPGLITGDSRGLGITTMRERATLIHGVCEITSSPGEGTSVRVWVPLTPQAALPSSMEDKAR